MSNFNDWNKLVIEEFRANEGKVGGQFENMTLLLLNTFGANSGKKRVNPVAYIKDGDRYVVAASKGGAPSHPDWYYNLKAHPEIVIEVGDQKVSVLAEFPTEPERTELYRKLSSKYPGFKEYEKKTSRIIPVVTLVPRA
jgi:deazaflavin-dependent oxidoreductase (nitroreductase family)